MQRIEPIIKNYAWGSREALARLAGRSRPSSEPQAELWVGAHEAGPSLVALDGHRCGLDEHIGTDTHFHLGPKAREAFGDRLPFLLKILAASTALSIQAHPDVERARSAPDGTYDDPWAKPEAWVPLEECEAFIGSLPWGRLRERLARLDVPRLDALVDAAAAEGSPELALLRALLTLERGAQEVLVREVVEAVRAAVDADLVDAERAALRTVLGVHEQFPGDVGVVVLLTMHHHVMTPGSSYFIPAGVLHSFVRGTTVEILANSDNVVRGGLTPKKVDVDELLTIVDVRTQVTPETPHPAPDTGAPVRRYVSHVPHFALWEVRPSERAVALPAHGEPALLLALDAPVDITCADERVHLERLDCAWWPAGDAPATVIGEPGSRLFVATLND